MEVYVPSRGAVAVYTGGAHGHFHYPPVFCIAGRVICANCDGNLTSVDLKTGTSLRLPVGAGELGVDDFGRFLTMDLQEDPRDLQEDPRHRLYLEPKTLQVVTKAAALDLPVSETEAAEFGVAADVGHALAKHTRDGRLKQWQVFESPSFGIIAVDIDRQGRGFEIKFSVIVVLTVQMSPQSDVAADETLHVEFTNVAGETVHTLHVESSQELPSSL
eukprot:TRINITY_DN74522_c0_g1_i1.p1 TRINITY_DN74522_c0_g1~~TRINITY_DN74522_c0_g1_i1.p1  ORF type:complete len:217 (+),score=21.77 TRINITY_DN74522_c0_g1_i1:213-863(+)